MGKLYRGNTFPRKFVNLLPFQCIVYTRNVIVNEQSYLSCDKTSLPLAEDESVQKFETCRCKLTKFNMYLQGHNMLTFSEWNYRVTTWGHHFTGRHSLIAHFNSIGSTSQLEDEVSNLVVLYVEGIWFFLFKMFVLRTFVKWMYTL